VAIEIRADAGFAVPALYEYCEKEGLDYTVGLISNPRLEALAEGLLDERPRIATRPKAKRPGCFPKMRMKRLSGKVRPRWRESV
jgi:hypothetical protein